MLKAELKPVGGLTRAQLAACQRLYRDWRTSGAAEEGSAEQVAAVTAYGDALRAVGRKPAALLLAIICLGQSHEKAAEVVRCRREDVPVALPRVVDLLAGYYAALDSMAAAAA